VPETDVCGDLVAFLDGELGTGRAQGFRAHLLVCARCREDLVATAQLDARLSDLGERCREFPLNKRASFMWSGTAVAARGRDVAGETVPGMGSAYACVPTTFVIGEIHLRVTWLPRWWQRAILWWKRVAEAMGADVGGWRPSQRIQAAERVVLEVTLGTTKLLDLHIAPDTSDHRFALPAPLLVPAERIVAFRVCNWTRERYRVDISATGTTVVPIPRQSPMFRTGRFNFGRRNFV
jgi:hypothetical protein